MSQADELLNSLDEGIAVASVDPETEPHIIIDDNRNITVPDELRRIAVQYDHNIETVTFDCPRYWDGHDLSAMTIYINYMRADGEKGFFVAENIEIDENDTNIMHFTWTISKNVTMYKGSVSFLICITSVDGEGNEELHWNSELCNQISVSEGLECHDAVEEEYPDIYTQLVNLVNANTFSDYYKDMIYKNASDIGVHTNEIGVLNRNVSNLETGLSATASRVTEVETDLSDNYYNKTQTDSQLTQLQEKVDNNTSNISENTSDISSLQSDINGLNAQVEYMSEHKASTTTVSANTTAISELDTRVTANENGVSRNSSDINALAVTIDKLQNADTQFSKDIASLNQTSTIAKSRADEALARNEFTDAEKSKLAGITNPMVIKGTVTSVSELPTNAETGWFYFVGAEGSSSYDEYCYSQNGWEYVGTSQEGVDLTNYYTKTETDTKINGINTAISALQTANETNTHAITDLETNLNGVNDDVTELQSDINGLNAQVEYMSEHKASTTTVSANTTAISELDTRVTEVETKAKSNASNINAMSASITNLQNADTQFSKDIASVNATATIAKSKAETNQTDISENKSEIALNKTTLGYTKKNLINVADVTIDKPKQLIGINMSIPKGKYICSYNTTAPETACEFGINTPSGATKKVYGQVTGKNSVELETTEDGTRVYLWTNSAGDYSDIMLRYADITDDTFEPYVESVDERFNKFTAQSALYSNTSVSDSVLTVNISNLFENYSAVICNVVTSSDRYTQVLPLKYIKSLGTSTYYQAEEMLYYYVDDNNLKIYTGLGQSNPTIVQVYIIGLY